MRIEISPTCALANRRCSSRQWKDASPEDIQPSPQHGSLPNITRAHSGGPEAGPLPGKRRRDGINNVKGEKGKRRQVSVVSEAASSTSRKNGQMEAATGGDERMTATDLAAKKMLLPFIKDLSFIEIALEEVRNCRVCDL